MTDDTKDLDMNVQRARALLETVKINCEKTGADPINGLLDLMLATISMSRAMHCRKPDPKKALMTVMDDAYELVLAMERDNRHILPPHSSNKTAPLQ